MTAPDIEQLDAERARGHRYVPTVAEHELVAVDRRGVVHQLNPYRVDLPAVEQRLVEGEPGPPRRSVAEIRADFYEQQREKLAAPGFMPRVADQAALRSSPQPAQLLRRLTNSLAAPFQWLADRLGGGKPNPEMMTPEQREAHATEQRQKVAAAEKAQPTRAEIEWLKALEKAKRIEAQWEIESQRQEKERDDDRWRGRERERER